MSYYKLRELNNTLVIALGSVDLSVYSSVALEKVAVEALNVMFGCSKCTLSNKEWHFFKATQRAMTIFQPNCVKNS